VPALPVFDGVLDATGLDEPAIEPSSRVSLLRCREGGVDVVAAIASRGELGCRPR
jgi:hypothetical protein